MIRLISFALVAFLTFPLAAQTGLWEVANVSVGERNMTPVAKWFDISTDGAVLGGNGGMINIRGKYTYSASISELAFIDEEQGPDPMGAFKVDVNDSLMTWQREEEGMNVTVTLDRIDKIPLGPWDKCIGPWTPEDEEMGSDLFMGWDRTYRLVSEDGTQRGIWHIQAHSPDLTTYAQDGTSKSWVISFPDDMTMVWTPEFGDDQVFKKAQ